jgi:hypothetical protein
VREKYCWLVADKPSEQAANKILKSYEKETKNLQKHIVASKVVNPLHVPSRPPFIGRRRDFYIPKIPSNPKNILSVNMYVNVFNIS